LQSMKVGGVSNIIQLDKVFTILRLNAHTPAGRQKFADVQAKLTKDLQQQKLNTMRAAFDQKLRQSARVEEP